MAERKNTYKKNTDKKNTYKKDTYKKDTYKKDTFRKNTDKAGAENKPVKKSRCPYFKKCGACQMIDTPYKKQLNLKHARLAELLEPYTKVESFIGMEEPEHYRCKVHAVFTHDRKGNPLSGIYKEGSHEVVPVESCLLEDRKADAIIASIRGMLRSFKIKTYDEDNGFGLLRHVLIRIGKYSGEIMVVLVTVSPIFPSKNNFVKALRNEHPEITTIVLNVNDKQTSMILGDKEKPLYGPGFIYDTCCGMKFKISPKSFYQVNPVQTELLYRTAIEMADFSGDEVALDCYSGVGTIGIISSPHVKEVISVESNGDAVKDAIFNAKINEVKNITFYKNDATRFMQQMADSGDKADVVFMDPPRSGSTIEFITSMINLSPKKIVYISCNPESLARDLEHITKGGYKVQKAIPVDMFPFTRSIETVCLLSKLHEAKHHINVKVDMDELDLTSVEAKATYKEIEEWVQENYGFHVTNLNIAQVKQKHGIIERENYNKPKLEKSRQPGCPEEKVKAIEEALKYFQMI